MTPHQTAILKKMQDPKFPELNFEFAFKLTNESERGALLIGAAKIEEYLERLILTILPSKAKSYISKLFNYPGPLSSFSGKMELAYAFRIINERVYNSLTALRKLRNEAAHSSNEFSLQVYKERLEMIYDFEDGFKEVVHKIAYKNLIAFKKDRLKESFETDEDLKHWDHEKLWNEHVPNPDDDPIIQEHLTVWKLAYGLTYLCTKIEVVRDEYEDMKEFNGTWEDRIH